MNTKLIKKIDAKTTEIEEKARKIARLGRKMKVLAVIAGVLLSIGTAFYLFYNVSRWYDENRVVFVQHLS